MATTTIPPCPPTTAGCRREEEVVGRRILDVWARGARGAGRVAPGGRGLGAMRGRGGRGKRGREVWWRKGWRGEEVGDGGDGVRGVGWWGTMEDAVDLLGVGCRLWAR